MLIYKFKERKKVKQLEEILKNKMKLKKMDLF